MIKARWRPAVGVVNTTFDLLVLIFTIVLLTDKFIHIGFRVNFDYFLAIILIFGFFSILLGLLTSESHQGATHPRPSQL